MGSNSLAGRVEKLEQKSGGQKHRDLSGIPMEEMTEEELILTIRAHQTGKSIDADFTAEELTVLIRSDWLDEERLRAYNLRLSEFHETHGHYADFDGGPVEFVDIDFNDKELRREIPEDELQAMIEKLGPSPQHSPDFNDLQLLAKIERLKALRLKP